MAPDTGPMIALAMIDRLEVLRSIFTEILVPEAVHNEILEGGRFCVGIKAYQRASWIERRSPDSPVDALLSSALGLGEAAVTQLERETGADYTLIDERKARKIARGVYELNVVGTAGMMVEAKKLGLVDNVGEELNRMKDSGYWIHDSIVSAAMQAAAER